MKSEKMLALNKTPRRKSREKWILQGPRVFVTYSETSKISGCKNTLISRPKIMSLAIVNKFASINESMRLDYNAKVTEIRKIACSRLARCTV